MKLGMAALASNRLYLLSCAKGVTAVVATVQDLVDNLDSFGPDDGARPYFGRSLSVALSTGVSASLRQFVDAVLDKLARNNLLRDAERSAWVFAVTEVVELLNDYRSSDPVSACNNLWVAWLTSKLTVYRVHDAARTAITDSLFNHLGMREVYLKKYLPNFSTLDDYYASQFPPDVKQKLLECLDENVESSLLKRLGD